MLEQRQIKKMARPFSDKQIMKEGPLKSQMRGGDSAWTNGAIILFDAPPDPELTDTDRIKEWVSYYGDKPSVRVFPVAIAKLTVDPSKPAGALAYPVIEFSDGNGTTAYANGRYVSSVLKRVKGKNRVAWTYIAGADALVGCREDGERLGVIMRIDLKKDFVSNRDLPGD